MLSSDDRFPEVDEERELKLAHRTIPQGRILMAPVWAIGEV